MIGQAEKNIVAPSYPKSTFHPHNIVLFEFCLFILHSANTLIIPSAMYNAVMLCIKQTTEEKYAA